MEKGKIVETGFQLPEAIIQHIQSFLDGKKAAQTTLLSKSWYTAWLTRPNLDFDWKHFVKKSDNDIQCSENRFWNFVNKTVERYEKLNLKIDSLRLWIYDIRSYSFSPVNNYAPVNNLIKKALKMGATGLDLEIDSQNREFILPHEVFGSKNLIRLSAGGCSIGKGADGKVSCSRLKSLTLNRVYVEGDVIWDIISSCPLIENLSLSISNEPALSPFTEFGKRNVGSVVDSPFNKLKCLFLSGIDVDALFFHDISSKFPCLTDLSVHHCGGYKVLQISSPSLECISFRQDMILRAKFDVPSIRKFTYLGPIPSLSFKNTTRNWESNISIRCCRSPSAKWILTLNKLLTKLSLSKVSLLISMCFGKRFECPEDIIGLPKPEVENLMVQPMYQLYPNCLDLIDVLFRCCRPVYVTQHLCNYLCTKYCNFMESCNHRIRNRDFMDVVYKRVLQKVGSNLCIANQSMSGECGLMGVDVEFFDEAVSAWRPRLLDASTSPGVNEQRIRLHLRWGC